MSSNTFIKLCTAEIDQPLFEASKRPLWTLYTNRGYGFKSPEEMSDILISNALKK